MSGWLDRLLHRTPAPGAGAALRGVPTVRRQKSYAALSGYVYEYFFEGFRDTRAGREFVFTASGDRKSWRTVEVRLAAHATAAWEREREYALGDRERYAVAKLALFSAFDEGANPEMLAQPVEITPELAAELLDKLDL